MASGPLSLLALASVWYTLSLLQRMFGVHLQCIELLTLSIVMQA